MIPADTIARTREVDLVATAAGLGANLKRVTATELAGPCLVCAGHDRFAVNRKRQIWHCRGCGAGGDVIALVRHVRGCDFREAVDFLTGGRSMPDPQARPIPPEAVSVKPATDNGDNREKALTLWRESGDPRVPMVERYLNRRALELDDGLAGEVLRWHSRLGAMVALFRNILTGEPQAVSRTFLDREGKKLERKFLGPVASAAIMLDPAGNVLGELHVGEGVETTMAARVLGLKPAWAVGSAGAIGAFPVLDRVGRLVLLGENDANGANARAVEACAGRWGAAGREVILIEPIGGKDLNDALANGIAP